MVSWGAEDKKGPNAKEGTLELETRLLTNIKLGSNGR